MGQTAKSAANTPSMREWASRLATKAPPKNYERQLKALYDGIIKRWRYVQEPEEWVHGTAHSLLGRVLGIGYNTHVEPEFANIEATSSRHKGWGDCDDVSTLTAAGVMALGMTPIWRVARNGSVAHVSVLARTPRGQWVSMDPVGYPEHPFGWAVPAQELAHYSLEGQIIDAPDGGPMHATHYAVMPMGDIGSPARRARRWLQAAVPRGHWIRTLPGDCAGARVLALPEWQRQSFMRGLAIDGAQAIDEHGLSYSYDLGSDAWVDDRLAGYGDATSRKARRKRRWKKFVKGVRRVVQKIARPIRKILAKILDSPIAQRAVAAVLQVYGVPMRLTRGVMEAAGEILAKGGLPALIRLLRKDPKAAAALVAKAVKKGLKESVKLIGVDESIGAYQVTDSLGNRYCGQPVLAFAGLPVHYLGVDIAAKPTPGSHYRIARGDNLLDVAGRAFGLKSGGERLARARLIAESPANARVFDPSARDNLFPRGKPSFSPRWSEDPEAAISGAPGKSYAVLWIPRAAGDLPDTDTPPIQPPIQPPIHPPIQPPIKPPIGPTGPTDAEFKQACIATGGHVITTANGRPGCVRCTTSERFDPSLKRCVPKVTIPPTFPPIKPPIQPPIEPPIEPEGPEDELPDTDIPPIQPPIHPPIQPPIFPPIHPPIEPPKASGGLGPLLAIAAVALLMSR